MSDSDISAVGDEIICDEIEEIGNAVPETEDLQTLTDKFADINIEDLKKGLDQIVQDFKESEAIPNAVAELVRKKRLNTMVLDLFDYDKGYAISFCKHGDREMFHGEYSYAVSLIEYIRDGEIPYEVFDNISKYDFKIFYDGYAICELRIHFQQADSMQSHFVLLKHSIQTIDAECSMMCKANSNLNFEAERARLIKYYSPDLCLDPDPVVAEIIISCELNQHTFISTYLKHIIENEKARREKGIQGMKKPKLQKPVTNNLKVDKGKDWNFRLKDPKPEEVELSKSGANLVYKDPLAAYLKERPICFPDKESFTGFPVQIENFVYEYVSKRKNERITDKFCISVLDDKEYYYGAYQLNVGEKEIELKPNSWWKIGSREELDIHVNAVTYEQMKLCCGGMKITHYRMFDEQIEFSDGKMTILRQKLKVPVSQVVLHQSLPSSKDENEEMDEI